jgi:hypothetical protein
MAILILGGDDDEHAAHMLAYLRNLGADAELLDSRDFPKLLRLTFNPATGRGTLKWNHGRKIDWDQVEAVYWRSYPGVTPADLPDPEQSYIAQNDARSLFESLLITLPARWINGWRAYQLHQTKPVQLARVASLNVPVPATCLGNDPQAIKVFLDAHPRSVFKPIQGGAHTRRITPEHLTDESLERLAYAPVTIQEEVEGVDVRVFVAGRRVLACQVDTEHIDFRDDPDPTIHAVELPHHVANMCLRIAEALELIWTGIDLRCTPDEAYVFLEANPSPMFLGFESRTGLPLSESLGAVLLGTTVA